MSVIECRQPAKSKGPGSFYFIFMKLLPNHFSTIIFIFNAWVNHRFSRKREKRTCLVHPGSHRFIMDAICKLVSNHKQILNFLFAKSVFKKILYLVNFVVKLQFSDWRKLWNFEKSIWKMIWNGLSVLFCIIHHTRDN